MIAQAYFNYAPEIKLFRTNRPRTYRDAMAVASLPLNESTERAADESLRTIGLIRVGEWRRRYWGREATVRTSRKLAEGGGT